MDEKRRKRDSNFEVLRILCIFGIIYMHSFGDMLGEVTGFNLVVAVFENALFNTGVSCFILISGYYGLKFKAENLIKLDMIVIFYSVLGTIVQFLSGENVAFLDWVRSFFPVISRSYWFISCYFCLVILSPYINLIPEKMNKKEFEKFLFVCLMIFSIIPTVFFISDNIMSDAGKGLVNMILVYLIGRYIRYYKDEHINRGKLLVLTVASIFLTFSLNMILSIARGVCTGNFARDCSITIILSSVLIFLFFKEWSFHSNIINFLAQHVIAAYVLETTVRNILNHYLLLPDYVDRWYLFAVTTGYVLVVLFVCFIINIFRICIFGKGESYLIRLIVCSSKEIKEKSLKRIEK